LARYPKISIDMVMCDDVVDLVGSGFDIAIRAGNLADSSLIARKLAPLRSVLCASPEYLERQGYLKKLADLKQHNCILYSYSRDLKK
jgi:DNA-binding transcriptional LysR family regulator